MFWAKLRDVKLFRTLRFRLASTFLLLLALVLALFGIVVTQALRTILENQSEAVLHEQLGAMRGYIHFDDEGTPYWFDDPSDPEEAATVGRLKTIYLIANDQGAPREGSPGPALKELFDRNTILSELAEIDKTKESLIKTVVGKDKVPYQVISSTMIDAEHDRKWYVAEGRSLAGDRLVL